MANQTVDVAALSAISKEVFPFGDEIWSWLNRHTPAMDLIDTSNVVPFDGRMSSDGKYWVFPAETVGHANPAVATNESSDLPAAGRIETTQVQFNTSSHFQRFDITGLAIDTMIGGEYSVQDGMEYQMRRQAPEARYEFNRLMHGDGSGIVAVVSSATGSTVTVDDATPFAVGTQFVIKGDSTGTLGAGLTGHPAAGTALEVTAVNYTTNVLTVTDENGTAVTFGGSPTSGSCYRYPGVQGGAINGFGIMVSDSNPTNWGSGSPLFGGLSRSANPLWAGYRHNVGSAAISIFNDLQPFMDRLKKRAGQHIEQIFVGKSEQQIPVQWYAFTGRQNMRIIGNALAADQRTQGRPVTLRGGWSGIEYEGAVFVADDQAPPSKVRFIHPPSARRWIVKNWFWDDRDGAIWSRKRSTNSSARDLDAFKAYMYTRQQNICIRCTPMGEIYGTTATS